MVVGRGDAGVGGRGAGVGGVCMCDVKCGGMRVWDASLLVVVLPPCPRCGQAVDKVWCGFREILGEWDGCNVLGVRGVCGL